ncbi:MAG: hypothetical protein IIW81_02640 [Oscillospiraceae bacterium]|nr:hypothetical protein [Oscillospiraceae bacterium]
MNRNFAKSEDGISLEFAPSEFDFNGVRYNATNSEEVYNKIGYFRLERTEAPVKDGFYYVPFYEEENGALLQKWKEHENPKEESFGEEEIEKAIAEGVNSIDE